MSSMSKLYRVLRRRVWYALDCPPTITEGLVRRVVMSGRSRRVEKLLEPYGRKRRV
jgi:hypothetical protein